MVEISRRSFVIATGVALTASACRVDQGPPVTKEDCIFCKIIVGTAPGYKVWEDRDFLAFLDNKPIMPGHVLIVPKSHQSYLFDMARFDYDAILDRLHRLEPPLRTVMQARRIGVLVEGFGVDHVHVHMIPLTDKGQIQQKGRIDVTEEEFTAIAEKVRDAFRSA